MSDTILKLEDITKIYPNGTVANRNINIELRKGEIHSIVGENGAGKSTLMKIIFGLKSRRPVRFITRAKRSIIRALWRRSTTELEWCISTLC